MFIDCFLGYINYSEFGFIRLSVRLATRLIQKTCRLKVCTQSFCYVLMHLALYVAYAKHCQFQPGPDHSGVIDPSRAIPQDGRLSDTDIGSFQDLQRRLWAGATCVAPRLDMTPCCNSYLKNCLAQIRRHVTGQSCGKGLESQQAETQYAWQSSEHNKSKEHLITVDPQKEGHPTVGERNPETFHPNYPIRNDWILNLHFNKKAHAWQFCLCDLFSETRLARPAQSKACGELYKTHAN